MREARPEMSELEGLIISIKSGQTEGFEHLVRRFQDMAVGYGYSMLHDFHLAQDAAQEAFLEAFRTLHQLREPNAFPGWFRRIVFKQCDRLTRAKRPAAIPLTETASISDSGSSQLERLEQQEMSDKIWQSVDSLPAKERETLVLFYIAGYSHKELSEFLDVPITTIKKRLYSGRNRLRDLLIDEVQDSLRAQRPSRDEKFSQQLMELIAAARNGDASRVMNLLEQDPRLLAARDPMGNTALVVAVNSGHTELAALLLEAGVRPDFFEAAAIGDTKVVSRLLDRQPELLDSFSAEGFTALALAAHFGQLATMSLLLERGANRNIVSRHPIGVTPLHAALFGGQVDAAILLIVNGADVTSRRGGKGWPRAGWTALHYAASCGFDSLIDVLIDRGADVNACDDEGKTPLFVAIDHNQWRVAELLRRKGAQE